MKKKNLSSLSIGEWMKLSGTVITSAHAIYGCMGCIFQTDHGAVKCKHKTSCFAHLRPDRKSVIFTKHNEK